MYASNSMNSFAFRQAREGFNAVRMVSVRAAVPFMGVLSGDFFTYGAIILIIAVICIMVYRESQKSRTHTEAGIISLEQERNSLAERIAERTRELITAETERLHELNRTAQLGELSRGLFHDLMSPLASVSMYMDKLGNSSQESTEAREVVQKVVTISQRMNAYMESVRRCIGNVPELSTQICSDLSQELPMVADILGYKARMAGVTLCIPSVEKIYLPLHPIRLHQLLLNLTSNAIEACMEARTAHPHQEYVVTLSAQRAPERISVHIADNGRGMSQAQVDKLFTHPHSSKEKGLGLGLRTVKSIVDELHGTIAIQSTVGKGTICTVHIPITDASD
jgi:C4-dicarboxylate-specific signal transduction histidine kinase